MVLVLTVMLVSMIQAGDSVTVMDGVWMFLMQFSVGVLLGLLLGKGRYGWSIGYNLYATSLYPILMLALSFFIYSFSNMVYGNGYLAVYIAGLVIGNSRIRSNTIAKFFDGIQWLSQLVMFLTLVIGRCPLSARACHSCCFDFPIYAFLGASYCGTPHAFALLKDRPTAQMYISWVGLRCSTHYLCYDTLGRVGVHS